jgi:hypothetical protein
LAIYSRDLLAVLASMIDLTVSVINEHEQIIDESRADFDAELSHQHLTHCQNMLEVHHRMPKQVDESSFYITKQKIRKR